MPTMQPARTPAGAPAVLCAMQACCPPHLSYPAPRCGRQHHAAVLVLCGLRPRARARCLPCPPELCGLHSKACCTPQPGGCAACTLPQRPAPRLPLPQASGQPGRLPSVCTGAGVCGARLGDLALLAKCTRLHTLDCSYVPFADLAPLTACTRLHALNCFFTSVVELAPLAACAGLQTLDCRATQVVELAPLVICLGLHTLICCSTLVANLSPLAACSSLHALDCSYTPVADLGPLAACTRLQNPGLQLHCSGGPGPPGYVHTVAEVTKVVSLGPLSSCTRLHTLDCSYTAVEDLGPLIVCTGLHTLSCFATGVADLTPLAACTRLHTPQLPLLCPLRGCAQACTLSSAGPPWWRTCPPCRRAPAYLISTAAGTWLQSRSSCSRRPAVVSGCGR